MTTETTLPLVVLAGGNSTPAALPDEADGLHSLSGYKGVDIKIAERCLIDIVLERMQASGRFAPLFVAGPRRIYGNARGTATVIDTDGGFGENLEAALKAASRACPGRPLAAITCDVLPKVEELHRLLADYDRNAPMDAWFPLILAPEDRRDLGASAWKPGYRVTPRRGAKPVWTLPGHLAIVDPRAFRLPLVYGILDLAYRSRNRPVLYRLGLMLKHAFGRLLVQDLRHLVGLRLPTMTVTVSLNALLLALHIRSGSVTTEEAGDRLRKIFVKYRHRRAFPKRRCSLPALEGLSLAKDIDTFEEAEETAREFPQAH